ncbi:MAG: NADH-quinone oxidoreductase subunit C [Deltaproteobacteria bacterium]
MSVEDIKNELIKKFPALEGKITVTRARRVFVEAETKDFEKIFAYAKDGLKFGHLVSITGFDETDKLAFMYHLSDENGILLNIRIRVDKAHPVLKTVTGYFAGADIYERELVDLFGARVEGLASGHRYPLTDDWPKGEYPLRKDWKQKEKAA